MPLIDLRTDLKSLKYGQDRPGGGSSGQPFIVTDPNGATSLTVGPNNILRLVGINRIPTIPNISSQLNRSRTGQFVNQLLYDDTLIRGGAGGAVQASLNDLFRIGAFMTTLPKGPLFIAKQVGLQLSSPKLEVKKGVAGVVAGALSPGGLLGTVTGGLLGPTRLYNLGINTLAQVPVNAFGGHFNRHGLLPVQDPSTKYESVVTFNNSSTVDSRNNRLIGYKNKLELGDRQYEASREFNLRQARRANRQANRTGRRDNRAANQQINNVQLALNAYFGTPIVKNPFKFKRNKLDTTSLTIDSYLGGPDSVYGVGRTIIKRYSFTEDKVKIDEAFSNASAYSGLSREGSAVPNYVNDLGSSNKFQDINNAISAYTGSIPTGSTEVLQGIDQGIYTTYEALRKQINTQLTQEIPFVSGGYSYSNYTATISSKNNPVNRTSGTKYYGTAKLSESGSKKTYDNSELFSRQDSGVMSVLFRAVNPFGQPVFDPNLNMNSNEQRWIFSAYMTGYKDDYNATWNETNYVGRAESFYVYNKFRRNVSFNLKIPCFNKVQLFEKHRALGQLASVTAGSYKDDLLLGGVLLKINVGNYLVGEYAILNSVNYSIPDDASWDISDDALLSMYIDANFSLTIVHKNLPRYRQADGTSGFFGYLPDPVGSTNRQTGFLTPTEVVNKFQKDK